MRTAPDAQQESALHTSVAFEKFLEEADGETHDLTLGWMAELADTGRDGPTTPRRRN